MSEENKTVQLTDEDLKKVTGGSYWGIGSELNESNFNRRVQTKKQSPGGTIYKTGLLIGINESGWAIIQLDNNEGTGNYPPSSIRFID